MDAFSIAIAKGIAIERNRQKSGLLLAAFFGGFQMLMPVIGWIVGQSFQEIIMSVDHWIAFGLLAAIGLKMIYDSVKKVNKNKEQILRLHTLLALAVATSIDALIVGLSFAFLQSSIIVPILIIGLVTSVLTIVGFSFGCKLGDSFGTKIRIVGGLILIIIGIRILIEHLV